MPDILCRKLISKNFGMDRSAASWLRHEPNFPRRAGAPARQPDFTVAGGKETTALLRGVLRWPEPVVIEKKCTSVFF